jgi:MFS family permease
VLGGALTQILSWRWCLYVNFVIAVPTAIFALRLLVNHSDPERHGIDLPGLLAGSAGLFALVYGFSNAETQSWTASATIIALAASVVLLCSFVAIERASRIPCCRCTSCATAPAAAPTCRSCFSSAGIFGVFFFLTYYMQLNLGFSPLRPAWPSCR